jgi:alkylhydroperoxidase/carboxymuconolactone decarboxylase family protein YurZ
MEGTTRARPGTVAHLAELGGAPARALKGFIDALYADTCLDAKTRELVFLGVQTALNLEDAVRAHVPRALQAGATRDEIVAAMMISVANGGLVGALRAVPIVDEIIAATNR